MSDHNFTPVRPVVVVGAAVGDLVIELAELPHSGSDIEAQERDRQIGGCAFNVARALSRLQVPVVNGIPVGSGQWGKNIEQEATALGLEILLRHHDQDNGWCLAMVEPCGERTFITVTGCEAKWDHQLLQQLPLPDNALIYASGYELVGKQGQALRDWLLQRPTETKLLLDLGPRLQVIDPSFIRALDNTNTILTLNRDENLLLCGAGDPVTQASQYAQQHQITLICRLDKAGAWLCLPDGSTTHKAIYPVTLVDSIGAGDAHCAGVLAGLSSLWPLADAIDLGNKVAAWVVSHRGAANTPTLNMLQTSFT